MLLSLCAAGASVRAQDEFEEQDDPLRLFNQGQAAHQRGAANKSKDDLAAAVEFYDEAIRLRPEFPEAEFQRALALAALERADEAEKGFRRAHELRPEWHLPLVSLGLLLSREPARVAEAEDFLRRALEVDPQNADASAALAELRARSGDTSGALAHWRRVTESGGDAAGAAAWLARGEAERASGEREAAQQSFTRALKIEPANRVARFRRAEGYFEAKAFDRAAEDLAQLEADARTDTRLALAVASLYANMERKEDAARVLGALPAAERESADVRNLLASLTSVDCDARPESRAALEYFRRANEADPRSTKYATGYAAALIQLRKFPEAAGLLKRVLQLAPDDYTARANFATALYELGLYKEAIAEYNWMARARPELAVVHFFIGSAHDKLGEFTDALAAYETFLARADASANGLEIGKVNLRLPSLRNQIKRGEGVKKKDAAKKKKG